jgi:hypothetical protein
MLLMLTVLAPGLPSWEAEGRRPGTPPVWLQPLAWVSGSALLASAAVAVVTGRPWALAAPGPTVETRLPVGRIAVPAQLGRRAPRTVDDPFVFGDLLRDPAIVMAAETPLGEAAPDEAREHLDALLPQPEGTRILEPPARVLRNGATLAAARYVHQTGRLWESAVTLIPRGDAGTATEILRIDVLLHPGASGAWRGLAVEVAASATATDGAERH